MPWFIPSAHLQGKQPPPPKENVAFSIGITPKKSLRRLTRIISSKKSTEEATPRDSSKVRRLIRLFDNKVTPSPELSRHRSKSCDGFTLLKGVGHVSPGWGGKDDSRGSGGARTAVRQRSKSFTLHKHAVLNAASQSVASERAETILVPTPRKLVRKRPFTPAFLFRRKARRQEQVIFASPPMQQLAAGPDAVSLTSGSCPDLFTITMFSPKIKLSNDDDVSWSVDL